MQSFAKLQVELRRRFSATRLSLGPASRCIHLLFFFNDTATTEIYTLSLHDALPIFNLGGCWSHGERGQTRCVAQFFGPAKSCSWRCCSLFRERLSLRTTRRSGPRTRPPFVRTSKASSRPSSRRTGKSSNRRTAATGADSRRGRGT